MVILRNFFLILISLSWVFSQIARTQLGNGLSLNILDIAIVSTAGIALVWFIYKKKLYLCFKDNIGKGILLFSSTAIISLLWNIPSLTLQQFIISSFYLIRWVSYVLLFLFIREYNYIDKKRIQQVMLLTGILFVLIGYIQFIYYGSLKNLFYLGWDEHMYRFFSVFLDPNFSGVFLVLFLLFIIGERLKMPQKPLTKIKLLLSVFIGCTTGALILTFSRSAFITLFFAFIVFFVLIGKKRWIIIVVSITLIVGLILSQRFYIESVNPFRTISSNARLISIKEALEIFSHQPVLGIGFNAYRYAQLRYGLRKQINIDTSHADAGTDNSFLFVLATSGIIGFFAYIIMLVAILQKVYKTFGKKRQIYAAVVFSSIVGLCVASMFTNALFFPPLMLWMWTLIGSLDDTVGDPSLRSG